MTNNEHPPAAEWNSREAATARAIDAVTCDPASYYANDGATVVHIVGTTPLISRLEDEYLCLGGASTQATVDHFYRDSPCQATVVSIHYREGMTCQQAVDALVD